MTNIIMAPHASLLEMTMSPQCNRCFGHLATALDNAYVAIPQVTAFYHRKYRMTADGAKAVVDAVEEELIRRHLTSLLKPRSEGGGARAGDAPHEEL